MTREGINRLKMESLTMLFFWIEESSLASVNTRNFGWWFISERLQCQPPCRCLALLFNLYLLLDRGQAGNLSMITVRGLSFYFFSNKSGRHECGQGYWNTALAWLASNGCQSWPEPSSVAIAHSPSPSDGEKVDYRLLPGPGKKWFHVFSLLRKP